MVEACCKLYVHVVEKLAFSSTVCVFGTRWINDVVALVFVLRFIDDVSVGDTARPGSHVGSRRHDDNEILRYLHIPKEKKNLKQIPQKQLQVGFDALMYMCLVKKKEKIKLFEITRFSFRDQCFGADEWTDSVQVSDGCAQKPERWTELCVIFSYFQKSLIVIVTLWKTLLLYYERLILHYIVDFFFSFWFSFLTEMLYHIF